jgi:hypothetical protein
MGLHPEFLHGKPRSAKTLRKIPIWARRPHGQHAAGPERRAGGAQSSHIVKHVICFACQLSLSEINSEHSDGVTRRELGSRGYVQRPEWVAVPGHPCSRIDGSAQRSPLLVELPLARPAHHNQAEPITHYQGRRASIFLRIAVSARTSASVSNLCSLSRLISSASTFAKISTVSIISPAWRASRRPQACI